MACQSKGREIQHKAVCSGCRRSNTNRWLGEREGSLWAGVIGGGLLEKVATEANLEGQGEELHQIEAMREDILGRGGQVQDMLRLGQVHLFGWNLGFV